ncbi:MAG TPA: carboxypeptidase regulatory-like domain-containing protein [Pyrinomonadaceae bacterium]|nr:carboxypeptidase regulatory-like domain-containing protein [Pyrinomonadaceae bacterium]
MSWRQRTPLLLIASLVLLGTALAVLPRLSNKAQAVQTAPSAPAAELIAQNSVPEATTNATVAQAAQPAAPASVPNSVVVPERAAPQTKAKTPQSPAQPVEAQKAQAATEATEVAAGDSGVAAGVSEKDLKAARARSAKAATSMVKKMNAAELAAVHVNNRRNPVKPRVAPGERFDKPAEAMSWYLKKRLPEGETELPVERYFTALAKIKNMPQFSTALNKVVAAKDTRMGKSAETQKSAGKNARDAQPNLVGDQQGGALGTWEDIGPGNVGGRSRALLVNPVDPNIMYTAGVAGGIWKSTNAGASWAPLDDFMPNIAVTCMAFDPDNPDIIWAGTGEGFFNADAVRGAGIFRSTNAGANWFRLPATNNINFFFVQDLVVSPADSNHIYAATRTGVHRSLDGGVTWTNVLASNAANGANGAMDLVMRTDQATDYIYASLGTFAQAHIWRNTDAGGAGVWTDVYTETNMGRTSLAIAPSNQNVIYAMAACNGTGTATTCGPGTNPNFPAYNYVDGLLGVFRSSASGDSGSWTAQVRNNSPNIQDTVLLSNPVNAVLTQCGIGTSQYINQGWYHNQLGVDPTDENKVWALGTDTFRSDNAGVNWGVASYWWFQGNGTPPNNGDPQLVHADNHQITFHPQYDGTTNQTIYIANDGGIYETDNGKTGNVGYATGTTPSGGLVTPTSPICGNEFTPGGFFTVPAPVIWGPLNNGYQVTQFYHGLPYPGGATYFGGTQDNGTNRGTDASGPNAWQRINGGDGGYVAVNPVNTQQIFAETTGLSIRRSDNGGGSFVTKTSGISGDVFPFITVFRMDPNTPTRLWIGGRFMWRTDNSGDTWVRTSNAQQTGGSITAMAIAPGNSNLVINGAASGQLRRTTTATTLTAASVLNTVWVQSFTPRGNGNGTISWLEYDPQNSNNVWCTISTFNGVANANGTSAGHVFKSIDGGATWTLADGTQTANNPNAIPDIPAHSVTVDPTNSQRIYAGTDLGVFVSLDGGGNWYKEVTGFANVPVETLTAETSNGKTRLFAFTHGRSAYRVTISSSCVTSVLPTNPPSFNKDGDTGTIVVTSADTTCDWTAATESGWIQINTGRTGTGTGAVTYTVLPNATSSTRTGTINVAGTIVTITQDAQPATASITGQVTDGTGAPIAAAAVTLTGTTEGATVTNTAGGYSFNGLTPGGNYTVTVAKAAVTFDSPSKSVANLQGIAVENFTGFLTPPPAAAATQGRLIISEFRLRGATSADDEFIELYNNSDSPLTITTTDGSEGWAVTGGDGNVRFIIPVNQTIPARGHYLATNSRGYSLNNYGGTSAAVGDATYSVGFPDDSGLALFMTARPANYSDATRLDSVGSTVESNTLAREGVGLPTLSTAAGEFSYVRKLVSGTPQDTGDNAADFVLVSTTGGVINGVQSVLGAPGPENLSSPINRTNVVKASLIDPQCSGFGSPTSACARVRTANGANPTNAAFGTLLIRRKFTNTSAQTVSRLRFRVVDITTLGNVTAGQADLRVLNSTADELTMSDGVSTVTLQALTVDSIPAQPNGGGLNTTLNLANPLAAGASVNVEFKLGVMTGGGFRFFVNVEALP